MFKQIISSVLAILAVAFSLDVFAQETSVSGTVSDSAGPVTGAVIMSGGTAMWVYGEGDGGIVNHPCDNSDWDHPQASLRDTGNAVYVRCNLK